MDRSEREGRLRFADGLRASADHFQSEQALRDALSRSYYSVFHLGCILLDKGYGDQKGFLRDFQANVRNDDLGKKMERLQELRIEADYRFDGLGRIYGGDPNKFRQAAFEGLALGREVFSELIRRIKQGQQDGDNN